MVVDMTHHLRDTEALGRALDRGTEAVGTAPIVAAGRGATEAVESVGRAPDGL